MKYEHLWADMHSNIHHNQMQDLDRWYQHAKQVMDFWPIAYYPFAIRRTPTGGELEDLIPSEDCARDWAQITALAKRAEAEGWPLFPGYEWQGNGTDGDHNVFFPDTDGLFAQPRTYRELRDVLTGTGPSRCLTMWLTSRAAAAKTGIPTTPPFPLWRKSIPATAAAKTTRAHWI